MNRKFWNWVRNDNDERILMLNGEISNETWFGDEITPKEFRGELNSGQGRVTVWINSPGGDCYSGLELVSVMDFIKSDVATTVLGMAASMGAVISSNGTKGKRFILPYSRFMIHQPSSTFGYSKFTDSEIALEEMKSVKNDLYEVLSKNSGKQIEEVELLCNHGDKWMKGQEIIDGGWADVMIKKA